MSENNKEWLRPNNILTMMLALVASLVSWSAWANNTGERVAVLEAQRTGDKQQLDRIESKIDRLAEEEK